MEASRTLARRYATSFPAEAGRRLETVESGGTASFLADLEPETAVAVIESMLPTTAAAAFETMGREALSAILEHLPVARCVLILRSVDRPQRATMVGHLPKSIGSKVERLLRSAEGSAGVLAEPVSAVLSPDMSVEQALQMVEDISGPYVYVVDADHRLHGVVHRRELATSDQRARVGNLMSQQVIRLPSAAPYSAVRNHNAWFDYDMLPVVDGNGVLVGVIRHRNIRRSGHSPDATASARQAGLAAFLDLGEVYWGSLTSVFTAMAGPNTPGEVAEVKHGA